jgi:hypothetical protein
MSSAFVFGDTAYFFSFGEVVDYYVGRSQKMSMQLVLARLEEQRIEVEALLSLFAGLCREQDGRVVVDDASIAALIDNDGIKLVFSSLRRQLDRMQEKEGDGLGQEMSLKVLMNILYICCDYLERNPTHASSSAELNQVFQGTSAFT